MLKKRGIVIKALCLLLSIFVLQACMSDKQEENNEGLVNNLEEEIQIEPTDNNVAQSAEPAVFVDAYEKSRMLGRGINLGNALDAPYEGNWDVVLQEEYFKLIKDKGFDSVRVPVRYSNKTTKDAPYTINESFMERVDWVLEHSLEQGLAVIIDLHHFDEMLVDVKGNKDRFLSIWDQVSKRYSNQPEEVFYELLNEPNGAITANIWNEYLLEAIEVIRSNDPGRTLIVGGADWNSINGLYRLKLPEDDRNIIATFHYYEPILVTHQGAEWMTDEYQTTGLTWPGPPEEPVEPNESAQAEHWVRNFFHDYNTKLGAANPASREAVIRDIERAAEWGKTHDRPLYLGEFGMYRTADQESRIAYTELVRSEAERHGMSWAYWEFGATFGVYDRIQKEWREDLVEALLPKQ